MKIYGDIDEDRGGGAWAWAAAALLAAGAAWKIYEALRLGAVGARVSSRKKIVILGAGFAGAQASQELARLLPESACEITLIDAGNSLLFTPMLTEVAGGQLDPRDIVSPLRRLAPRVRFEQGRIDSIDLGERWVQFTVGASEADLPATQRQVTADHLLMALGSVTDFHHIPGLADHAIRVKSLADAAQINNRVLALLERASEEPDEAARRAILTVVVGGGGFSGVETMAAVNDFLRGAARSYPAIDEREIRTVIVHPGKRLLEEIGESLAAYAQEKLQQRGVEVMLQKEIAGATGSKVSIKGGEEIDCLTLIWTAGVEPNPLIAGLDCEHGKHGGVAVDATCAVKGRPGVWAVGDCAEVPAPGGKHTYAPTAQNATREGAQAARNIVAEMTGGEPKPFVYHPMGEMALVGRHCGVASLFGLQFAGLPAWIAWRAVYLAKMPGVGKRLRIATDWLLDLFFGREISELPSRTREAPEGGKPARSRSAAAKSS